MKCEICHEREAQTAIERDGGEELYVCEKCAVEERSRRKKKRERTRTSQENSAHGSVEIHGNAPPQILDALLGAVSQVFGSLNRAAGGDKEDAAAPAPGREQDEAAKSAPRYKAYRLADIDARYLVRGRLHLEGLHLIGELDAVKRAVEALDCRLEPLVLDGVQDSAHAFGFAYCGRKAAAERIIGSIVEQERNARVRLVDELPRVFGDAVCRALAILKNCRMLSNGEALDLLSPLRIAALCGRLEGIGRDKLEGIIGQIDLTQRFYKTIDVRENFEADIADMYNDIFENVMLKS